VSLSKKSNSKYTPKQENSILKAKVVSADISAYPANIYFESENPILFLVDIF